MRQCRRRRCPARMACFVLGLTRCEDGSFWFRASLTLVLFVHACHWSRAGRIPGTRGPPSRAARVDDGYYSRPSCLHPLPCACICSLAPATSHSQTRTTPPYSYSPAPRTRTCTSRARARLHAHMLPCTVCLPLFVSARAHTGLPAHSHRHFKLLIRLRMHTGTISRFSLPDTLPPLKDMRPPK